MSVNAKMIIFSAFLVVLISGMALYIGSLSSCLGTTRAVPEKPIGGERSDYGCLGPAGYSWNKEVEACVREWELTEIQRRAAKVAIEYVGFEEGITVIKVQEGECSGCFFVEVEKGSQRIKITLEDYEVTETAIGL